MLRILLWHSQRTSMELWWKGLLWHIVIHITVAFANEKLYEKAYILIMSKMLFLNFVWNTDTDYKYYQSGDWNYVYWIYEKSFTLR